MTASVPAATLIERTKALVASDANAGITVAEIARRLNVSKRLLEHRYKTLVGQTLKRTILRQRLETARRLIRTTSRPFVRIAADCGFCDAQHLAHAFSAAYGHSPSRERAVP